MRVDANVSVRPEGSDVLNAKVEIKNMNSIRHAGDAVAFEIERQTACLKSGEPIITHTRLWDPDAGITAPMRGKFEGPCVPDPSVPPILIDEQWLQELRRRLPEMPGIKAERYMSEQGLTREEALQISAERKISHYFEKLLEHQVPAGLAAQWLMSQLLPLYKEREQTFADLPLEPVRFAELLKLLEREEINAGTARDVLRKLLDSNASAGEIVDQCGYRQVSQAQALGALVERVLEQNPSAVENFRKGVSKAFGFLMGQAMQASAGKANPRILKELLTEKLK